MSHVWKESRGSRGPIGNSKFKMHGAEARHLSIKYKVTTSFGRLAWEGSKDGGRENKLWNITRHIWNILHHDILVKWKKYNCMFHFEYWYSGYNYKHSERLLINNIVSWYVSHTLYVRVNWTALNEALRHEGQWGSGDVAPRIFNHGNG